MLENIRFFIFVFFFFFYCCSFFVPVSICWTIVFAYNDDMRMCIAFKWLNKVEHMHKLYNILISRINSWRVYLKKDVCYIYKNVKLRKWFLIPTESHCVACILFCGLLLLLLWLFDIKELFQRQFTRENLIIFADTLQHNNVYSNGLSDDYKCMLVCRIRIICDTHTHIHIQ